MTRNKMYVVNVIGGMTLKVKGKFYQQGEDVLLNATERRRRDVQNLIDANALVEVKRGLRPLLRKQTATRMAARLIDAALRPRPPQRPPQLKGAAPDAPVEPAPEPEPSENSEEVAPQQDFGEMWGGLTGNQRRHIVAGNELSKEQLEQVVEIETSPKITKAAKSALENILRAEQIRPDEG